MTKIFGIGLSKTGTTSLYAALAQLGFRSITYRHMRQIGVADWFEGRFVTDYLDGIDAATDLPVATYFRELDARYPGSKFVLTVREVEPWLVSIQRQFGASEKRGPPRPFARDVRLATYGASIFNEARFRRVAAEHMAGVRAHFADRPDQLLVLNLFNGEGWAELCPFLGVEMPDGTPFPNVKPGYEAYPDPETRFSAYPYPAKRAGRAPGRARGAVADAGKPGRPATGIADVAVRDALRQFLAQRSTGTFCPSEIARHLAPDDWRPLMPVVRRHAAKLQDAGELQTYQKGAPVDPRDARGPIRLGRPSPAQRS
ncbi:MAG: DUF3253 domain-containing protein [Pseudomonadota bacterium]